MASNLLGDSVSVYKATSLISTGELSAREGVMLQKGMNFRDKGPLLSVFLVLPTHDGEYTDSWNPETGVYLFEGHDSITTEGKSDDQLLMYGSGKLSENGKFFKAANAYIDGMRSEPLQIQVYEKIDSGVWFAKGIFNLVDAMQETVSGRKICKYHLMPADWYSGFASEPLSAERMLSTNEKIKVWQRDQGKCVECGSEIGLRFVRSEGGMLIRLNCATHRGEAQRGGLLG